MNRNCFEKIKKAIEKAKTLDCCNNCGHVSDIFEWVGLSGDSYGLVRIDDDLFIKFLEISKIEAKIF